MTSNVEEQFLGQRIDECPYLSIAIAVSREAGITLEEAKSLTYVEALQALGAVCYG